MKSWWLFIAVLTICSCAKEEEAAVLLQPQEEALDTTAVPAFSLKGFSQIDAVAGLQNRYPGVLDTIVAKRRLRVLVPYSQTTYYIEGTERRGIAYEAMLHFEEYLNRRLGFPTQPPQVQVVFIPLTRDQLIPALLEGYGDLIAESLTVTPSREDRLLFTEPIFSGAREILVRGAGAPRVDAVEELAGKTVHVRFTSSFFEHLLGWNDRFAGAGKDTIQLLPLEEYLEDEEVLELVDAGIIPYTVMESSKAEYWSQSLDSVRLAQGVVIDSAGQIAWALQPGSTGLKELLDDFIRENRKGTLLGNIIFNRYLKSERRLQSLLSRQEMDRFFQLQDYFIRYGERYQLPWMLLAALAYQESRFDQSLRSHAGAVGIMQVLPGTARDPIIGIPDIWEEEANIHAGVKFLRFVIDQYFIAPEIDSLNAGLFGLASYNAGPHRVNQLRRMAQAQGLNPNVWFNNVEVMAAREIGRETVQYVSNIYKYYISYRYLFLYAERTGRLPWDSGF